LYEEMLTEEEGVAVTRHERIFVAPAAPLEPPQVERAVETLLRAAEQEDWAPMLSGLQGLLPNYTPSASFIERATRRELTAEHEAEAEEAYPFVPAPANVPRLDAPRVA